MKKAYVISIAVFALSVLAGHVLALRKAPTLIMSKAMQALSEKGRTFHEFTLSPRITPQTQTVVRPSPDLAYSICLFDLSLGPVLVKGKKWDGYGSLTIFNAATDVAHISALDSKSGDTGAVMLTLDTHYKAKDNTPVVVLEKPKGIALIRRLAPTPALYAQVETLSGKDVCMAQTP